MTSIQNKMKIYVIIVSSFMLLFLVGYLTTTFQSQFLGLIVGLFLSFVNLWTTYRKSIITTNAAAGLKRYTSFSYIVAGLGFAIRITLTLFGVWLALEYPEYLDLIAVITGLALIYVIIMADMLVEFGRKR